MIIHPRRFSGVFEHHMVTAYPRTGGGLTVVSHASRKCFCVASARIPVAQTLFHGLLKVHIFPTRRLAPAGLDVIPLKGTHCHVIISEV